MSQLEKKAEADHAQALENTRIAKAVELALKEENETTNKSLLSQKEATKAAENRYIEAEVKEHKTEFDLAQAREAVQRAESSAKAAQAEQQKANKEAKDAILAEMKAMQESKAALQAKADAEKAKNEMASLQALTIQQRNEKDTQLNTQQQVESSEKKQLASQIESYFKLRDEEAALKTND